MAPKKVLITGVYGLIAGALYERLAAQPQRYDTYGMGRRRHRSMRSGQERVLDIPAQRFTLADLSDAAAVRCCVAGMDVVVQMAADPRTEAPFEKILESNIIGVYNVFEACRLEKVKRVVYASSVMASWGYQFDEPYKAIKECRFGDVPQPVPRVGHKDLPRPTEPYSASKIWGEALARTYSDVHGLSCLCVRIGWVNDQDRPFKPELASVWCSQRDITQLTERCINASDEIRFDIFYGVSDNRYRWVDTDHARSVLGHVPQDRAEDRL